MRAQYDRTITSGQRRETASEATRKFLERCTMTLTEFLLARIAEDEMVAQDVRHWAGRGTPMLQFVGGGTGIRALADPERWLAECEAKRRIVERGPSECGGYESQGEFDSHHYPDPAWSHCDGCSAAQSCDREWLWTLAILALPYADHPDYRDEWRP